MSPGFWTRICKTVVSILRISTCAIRCKWTDAWVPKKRRSPPPEWWLGDLLAQELRQIAPPPERWESVEAEEEV
eukprot:scaffold77519_cov66-Attheya_sp.AAC.1